MRMILVLAALILATVGTGFGLGKYIVHSGWTAVGLIVGGIALFYLSTCDLMKKQWSDAYSSLWIGLVLLVMWIIACIIAVFIN